MSYDNPKLKTVNLRPLLQTWDNELATVAQRHADQCNFAHDCSDCRKVDRCVPVGDNLLNLTGYSIL